MQEAIDKKNRNILATNDAGDMLDYPIEPFAEAFTADEEEEKNQTATTWKDIEIG